MFRAAPVGIGLVADHVLLEVNDRLCEMTGYRREELIGRNSQVLYPTKKDWEHVGREEGRQTRAPGTATVETRWQRKDGAVIDVLLSSAPLDPGDLSQGVTFTALDITDRKNAEDELRSIFNLSVDLICIADIRTNKFTKVNPAFERTLGYEEQELLSRPFTDFIHPDDVENTLAVIREKLGVGERVFSFENRFRGKDGSYRWLNWTAHPRVEQGLTYAIGRDVTEHKRVENALRESLEQERSLGDLIRYASVAICVCSPEGRLQGCNPAFCDLTGYTQEELTTIAWRRDLTPPQWREQEAARLEELVRNGKAVRYEKECIRKDGSIVPVEMVVHPEFDSEGRLKRCFTFITDITDRKRAENTLRFTQFAVDHTADGAFWMNTEGRFCYVNEAACRALGYSRDELLEMTVFDIDPLFTQNRWAQSWRTLKEKKSLILETVHRTKDGRTYPVEIRANYVEFGGHEYDCAFARDITERRRAEEALRESEARHRRLVDNLKRSHFVYRHDTEGVFQYVSESLIDLLGYTAEEFMDRYDKYLTDHPANQAARRHTELTIQGTSQPPYEVQTWHKDGSTRWLEVQEVPVFDDRGKVVAVEGVAQDITERKQAEEALRESEERHRFLVESVNDWIWEVDQNGVYTYASPQCREILGYEPEEIVGKTPFDLMPPEEGRRMREAFVSCAGQAKPFRRLENVNRRKDGRLVVLETSGAPVLDAQGKLAGYRGVDRDITERKEAEEALREKEYLLSESQRIGHIGTWSVDLTTNVTTWTRETYRLCGVSPETFVPSAEGLLNLMHPDDRGAMREWMRAALAGEGPEALEFRVVLPDGSIRMLSGRGELILADDGRPLRLVGTAQDVTERRRAEEALRRLNEHLETLVAQRTKDLTRTVARLQQMTWELSQAEDRERKRIADLLHDDVQQILAGARFHLSLLCLEPRSAEESQEIIRQVRKMLREAIEKARSLSHELSPALYQVEPPEILNWLADHMRRKHGLTVHVEARGRVDSSSEALKALLYKVAQELLFNVVKHAGVKEATVRLRRRGRYIGLSVIDRGRGFDPREFERTGGFGLLSIRERIHHLGGRVRIRSTRGKGSRILIIIPDEGPAILPGGEC